MPDESNKTSFWHTLPGLITAITGFVSAIAALVGLFVPKPPAFIDKHDPPKEIVPARTATKAFNGRFEIEFSTESTLHGGYNKKPWFTFVMTLSSPDGKAVRGSLSNDMTTGFVRGSAEGLEFTGTLRLAWDKEDWKEFHLQLDEDGNTGSGTATSFTQADGDVHYYSCRIKRTSG